MTAKNRGRPEFQPTPDDRVTVEQMAFCGEDHATIARAIGIDPRTLKKAFPDELANGHAHRRKEVIDLLFDAARKGNVAAAKHLEAMGRAPVAAKTKPAPAERIGKKEEAEAAANRVSGKYEPARPPLKLVKQ